MGNLPNLDESTVSIIGYYNITEQTSVDEVNPQEMNDIQEVTNTIFYDNGVIGEYQHQNRNIRVRFKTDGWIVAYLPSVNDEFETNTSEILNGTYDISDSWTDSYSSGSSNLDSISSAISHIISNLGIWGSIQDEFSQDDISLYSYEYSESSNISLFSHGDVNLDGGGSASFIISDPTTVYYGSVVGSSYSSDSSNDGSQGNYEGQLISSVSEGTHYGTIDISQVNKGEEKQTSYSGSSTHRDVARQKIDVVIIWE